MKKYTSAINIPLVVASLTVSQIPVFAQQTRDVPVVNRSENQRLSETQIKNAQPYQNPLLPPNTSYIQPDQGSVQRNSGATPGVAGGEQPQGSGTRAFGSHGVPFTSKRVSHQPISTVSSSNGGYLSATYPYRAIGRLTFNAGFCSASLIRRSVIVTAAHCIQDFGSGSNIFSGFTFTPAFYNGSAPYGSWSWGLLVRPSTWANGTDTGSGSARNNDLAVILLNKNSAGQFIGDITGYLTYAWNNYSFVSSSRTGNLSVAAITTSGYPALLDSGQIQQRSDGPSFLTTISSAKQIYQGSNFTGGSSGGPWLVNFGYQNPSFSGGANAGDSSVSNVIVGVTSWGSSDPNNPKDNYSSQFGQNTQYPSASYGTFGAGNIASLLNTLCSNKPSGSAQTYQQLGYCN